MSLFKTISSAIGKLAIVVALLAAFFAGLVSVVWLSLRGEEIKVPEIIGKDRLEAEKELAALGLKMKKRAERFSEEAPNTVLEQLPKSGETVKTGQVISVVISRINPEGSEDPASIEKPEDEDSNTNSETPGAPRAEKKKDNSKKPASMTRDVESNKANKNKNTSAAALKNANTKPIAANKGNSNDNKAGDTGNKNGTTPNPGNKNTSGGDKPTPKPTAKPAPANSGGDIRPRKIP